MRRLRASSGAGVSEATWATGGNRVVPTTHAERGGIVLVAVGFVEAREGRMRAMGAESVGPAVVHLATLNSDVTRRSGRQRSWWSNSSSSRGRCAGRSGWGRGADCVVPAMIAGVAGGEAANSLLVAKNEVCFLKIANVQSVRGRRQNFSVNVVRRPVFSIISKVSVMVVISARGTSPNAATRWMFAIFAQRSSIRWVCRSSTVRIRRSNLFLTFRASRYRIPCEDD